MTVTESEGAFDIWNGVKATNSIGYDEDLDYVIKMPMVMKFLLKTLM